MFACNIWGSVLVWLFFCNIEIMWFNVHRLYSDYVYKDHSTIFLLQHSSTHTSHAINNWVQYIASLGRVDLNQYATGYSYRLPPDRTHQSNTDQHHFDLPMLKTLEIKLKYMLTLHLKLRLNCRQHLHGLQIARERQINNVSKILYKYMMTSSNGNIFRVTGHLCGEFTGPRWIPPTKASDAELWCLLWSAPK